MSDVEFSEERAYRQELEARAPKAKGGNMARLLIQSGLAKDDTGATIILFGFSTIIILAAVVIFLSAP